MNVCTSSVNSHPTLFCLTPNSELGLNFKYPLQTTGSVIDGCHLVSRSLPCSPVCPLSLCLCPLAFTHIQLPKLNSEHRLEARPLIGWDVKVYYGGSSSAAKLLFSFEFYKVPKDVVCLVEIAESLY